MKAIKRIIIFTLCLIMCLSLFGCKGSGNAEGTIPDSSDYFIENGVSNYRIVISENPQDYEKHAANELKKYVEQATKVVLPILSEAEVVYNEDSKLLILGETQIAQNEQVVIDKNVYGGRGFVIKKIDTNVFMVGGSDAGTLYSVYEFLHYQLDFEVYDVEEVALKKGVTSNLLKDYDLSEIPDIPYVNGMGLLYRDTRVLEGHMMRFNVFNEVFINATSQPWHNSFAYVSPAEYYDDYPEWFTGTDEQKDQFHYTAHGNEESLNELREVLLTKFKEAIDRDFAQGNYYEYIGFMQQDSVGHFPTSDKMPEGTNYDVPYDESKDTILALKERYGSVVANAENAAMLIQFVNPLAIELRKFMETNYPGRTMNIMIFAYEDSETAPVKFDAKTGKYVPIDDAVKCESNVSVFLAPIRNDYIQDAYDSGADLLLSQWSAVTDKLALWYHNYYFQNSFIYYDSTYSLQSYYRLAKENKTVYLFNEVPIEEYNSTSFGRLKLYLNSKLGWDVDADVDTLVDNFFINYYKNSSVTMRKFFEELRTHVAMLKATQKFKGICGASTSAYEDKKLWPEAVVNSFLSYIEQAYKDIEPLKSTDYATWEKLRERIEMESLMPRYLALRFYGKEMFTTDLEFNTEVSKFKSDCYKFNIRTYSYTGGSIEDLTFSR